MGVVVAVLYVVVMTLLAIGMWTFEDVRKAPNGAKLRLITAEGAFQQIGFHLGFGMVVGAPLLLGGCSLLGWLVLAVPMGVASLSMIIASSRGIQIERLKGRKVDTFFDNSLGELINKTFDG